MEQLRLCQHLDFELLEPETPSVLFEVTTVALIYPRKPGTHTDEET